MPRLTDQERQEINRYLEADRPLPDKYRFLLFQEKREVELVWNGKTGEVTNLVLPFQVIEQVDEPRAETPTQASLQMDLFDVRGRQKAGWTNKLIWGDNKLVLSSLKNGPAREEIERNGGIKLVYVDPPFSAGIDYSINIHIGGAEFSKKPSILEEFAYSNTWSAGGNTFIQMLYERVALIQDLLSADGILFFRIDHHWGHYAKTMLDELFGKDHFQSEITVNRIRKNVTNQGSISLPTATDSLFVYFKSRDSKYTHLKVGLDKEREGYWRRTDDSAGVRRPPERHLFGKEFLPPPGKHFKFSQQTMERMVVEAKLRYNDGLARLEYWVEPTDTKVLDTNWTDIPGYSFTTGYPTENAEQLLKRVLDIASRPGDLVADFFSGSGTTAAVAEKLNRKWIACDLGKFAIHTTRKRMIGVQRQLRTEGKDYRAFEILNLGKYERQHYIGINPNLRETEQRQQLQQKEAAFVDLILHAYRAEKTDGFATFHGKKAGRLVAIGPINMPVSRLFVEEVMRECVQKHISRADILGFEFEMGLFPNVLDDARAKGIDIAPKYIPAEVFDRRAVERNQVVFHDVSFVEVKPHIKKNSVAVELTDFSVFYSQDSIADAEVTLKDKASKIVVERGQIIKVSKDKSGIVSREVLTKHWTDWIDYWSVDFDFESKREIIRVPHEHAKQVQIPVMQQPDQLELSEYDEKWTGSYIFENEWQSFRTKQDRELELRTPFHECEPGPRKIAVKVVDIFGTDTMTILGVQVGGKQ